MTLPRESIYARSYVTPVVWNGKALQTAMGRVGIEPTPWRLKVRVHELRRTASNGNVLQGARIATATNCSGMRGMETTLYARSYARVSPGATTALRIVPRLQTLRR